MQLFTLIILVRETVTDAAFASIEVVVRETIMTS